MPIRLRNITPVYLRKYRSQLWHYFSAGAMCQRMSGLLDLYFAAAPPLAWRRRGAGCVAVIIANHCGKEYLLKLLPDEHPFA